MLNPGLSHCLIKLIYFNLKQQIIFKIITGPTYLILICGAYMAKNSATQHADKSVQSNCCHLDIKYLSANGAHIHGSL